MSPKAGKRVNERVLRNFSLSTETMIEFGPPATQPQWLATQVSAKPHWQWVGHGGTQVYPVIIQSDQDSAGYASWKSCPAMNKYKYGTGNQTPLISPNEGHSFSQF